MSKEEQSDIKDCEQHNKLKEDMVLLAKHLLNKAEDNRKTCQHLSNKRNSSPEILAAISGEIRAYTYAANMILEELR